jgi:hypothetical protein
MQAQGMEIQSTSMPALLPLNPHQQQQQQQQESTYLNHHRMNEGSYCYHPMQSNSTQPLYGANTTVGGGSPVCSPRDDDLPESGLQSVLMPFLAE